MTIKPEIQEKILACSLGGNQDYDMTLVEVRTGADGSDPSLTARRWVINNLGVKKEDVTSIEYAGRAENGANRLYLVTWTTVPAAAPRDRVHPS